MPSTQAQPRSAGAKRADPETCFQTLILKLQGYWADRGCVLELEL